MELINYFGAAAASYIGLAAGMFLSYANLDELKPGRKYFFMLKKIFLASAATVCAYGLAGTSIISAALLILSAMPMILMEMPLPLVYVLLGMVFYVSSTTAVFPAVASLIFLFGIPSGTIAKSGNEGKIKKGYNELVYCLGFFISAVLFLL